MSTNWTRLTDSLDEMAPELFRDRLRRIAKSGPDRSKADAELCKAMAKAVYSYWWPPIFNPERKS